MITRTLASTPLNPLDEARLERIPKADLPIDTFERGPARDPAAPLSVGEARALPGRTRVEGTSFEPRSAVYTTEEDGTLNIVLSDEADLAQQLQQHTRGPIAHRMFLSATGPMLGRTTGALKGRLGMFQFPQDMGDTYFRAQVYLPGKVTLDLTASDETSLQGRYRARSMNAPSGGKIAGEFTANRLELGDDWEQAAVISGLCSAGQPRRTAVLTKTLRNDFVSVTRSNASVTRAIAGMQAGPAALDVPGPAAGLGYLAAQHALIGLGWQALARVADFYGIDRDTLGMPSTADLASQWLWPKARRLRKAREKLEAAIAKVHGVGQVSLHFADARGLGQSHRELYVSFKHEASKTQWIVPGLVKRTTTAGSGETVCVPILAERQERGGSPVNSLAGEAATLAAREHKFFVRDDAGKFSPWEPPARGGAIRQEWKFGLTLGLGALRGR